MASTILFDTPGALERALRVITAPNMQACEVMQEDHNTNVTKHTSTSKRCISQQDINSQYPLHAHTKTVSIASNQGNPLRNYTALGSRSLNECVTMQNSPRPMQYAILRGLSIIGCFTSLWPQRFSSIHPAHWNVR